jgi:hypothetical protein
MDTSSTLQWGWWIAHLAALALAWLVRAYHGRPAEGPLQAGFLASLALMGVATLAGRQFLWSLWPLSAFTLALMIVGAVLDLEPVPTTHRYPS